MDPYHIMVRLNIFFCNYRNGLINGVNDLNHTLKLKELLSSDLSCTLAYDLHRLTNFPGESDEKEVQGKPNKFRWKPLIMATMAVEDGKDWKQIAAATPKA